MKFTKKDLFYKELCSFMVSGPVVVIALEKKNAVADYRTLIGATDPAEAAEGTIRKLLQIQNLKMRFTVQIRKTTEGMKSHSFCRKRIELKNFTYKNIY